MTLFVVVAFCTNCIDINCKTALAPLINQRRNQPVEIYIDNGFSDIEKQEIQYAFDEWVEASNGVIKFNAHWNSPKPGRFYELRKPKNNQGIFLWQLELQNPNDITKDLKPKFSELHGLFIPGPGNNAANVLILTDLVPRDHFYQVAVHEIGHLLGLEHVMNHADAIMSPHASGECITKWDLEQLCGIYSCIPHTYCVKLRSTHHTQ